MGVPLFPKGDLGGFLTADKKSPLTTLFPKGGPFRVLGSTKFCIRNMMNNGQKAPRKKIPHIACLLARLLRYSHRHVSRYASLAVPCRRTQIRRNLVELFLTVTLTCFYISILKNCSGSVATPGRGAYSVGTVPSLKHSKIVLGDSATGSKPVVASIWVNTTPSGT